MDRRTELKKHFEDYRTRLSRLLDRVNLEDLERAIAIIVDAFKKGKTVYLCGNGGSAATASHMQVDLCFLGRHCATFRPKSRALTNSVPMVTGIGNDCSFEDIFVEQIKGIIEKGDVMVCISASGNSENVIRAAQYVNENGGISIGFMGFAGGKLKEVCSCSVFTPNPKGDYGPIEDLHMIYDHLITSFIVKDEEFLSVSGCK